MLRTPETTSDTQSPAGEPDPATDRSAVPSRLVVQRGLFFGPSATVPEDLYAVVEQGIARRERDRVHLHPGRRGTTNTNFGRLQTT